MCRIREQLIMAKSVAETCRLKAEDKEVNKQANKKVYDDNAPTAAAKHEAKSVQSTR